jgi:hypothetical protein
MKHQTFIVFLRQPRSSRDHREDPYWEVGSFGCTGCHEKNLLNPRAMPIHIPDGARLAFAQGGEQGTKLVFLTPPVQVFKRTFHKKTRLEVKWNPRMPFRYENAPVLIDVYAKTDFPKLQSLIGGSRAENWRHKLSGKFRTRVHPLPHDVAEEVTEIFDQKISTASTSTIAETYLDAIPEWELWYKRSKEDHPWKPNDRAKAYKNAYAVGILTPRSCGKRGC